ERAPAPVAPRARRRAGRAAECRIVLRVRRGVLGEAPGDRGRDARREGRGDRGGGSRRRGVGRRQLSHADRRPAVAPRVVGPRAAARGRAGVPRMTFETGARAALSDAQLRGALRQATTLFAEKRRAAMATVPDWEGARDRARAIKDETLLHLDRYLDQFTGNAERAGARTHWARDAAEACEIIGRIAEQRGARTIVKSKSMATEEIHLNAALARRGIEPIETDLGEYIIQLAGETPSHIVAPAIHKTKGQIAALFAEKLGIEPSDDAAALTAAARQALRRRFAEADLGISGVNFAVAETGRILILEHEGNARLTTSLPRTHIALMGIGQVIPRLACRDVCPVKIDIPALLLHLRGRVISERAGGPRLLERLAFRSYAAVMLRPRLYEWVMRIARALHIRPPLRAWTKWRDLRPLAQRSFREEWRAGVHNEGKS